MNSNRKTAIIVGVLFIIGTVAGSLGAVVSGPLQDPDYLVTVSANENQIMIGAFLVLIMGVALVPVPVMLFPILKKRKEALSLGYVVFRVLEGVTYIATIMSMLLLLTLSQEYVKAGAPDASYFQTLGTLLLEAGVWVDYVRFIVFSLSALILNYVLYQLKLIPRWLSVFGLLGGTLHLVAGLLGMFGLLTSISPMVTFLAFHACIMIQEMVFAVWLIVKGFNPSAIVSESTKQI